MDAIPFDFAPGAIPAVIVRGEVGRDSAGTVVIDTGAVGPYPVFLSEARARALGLKLSPPLPVTSSTALGAEPQTYRTAMLPIFRLGSVRLTNVTIAVTPVVDALGRAIGRQVDAVVGYEFLRQRIVSIDYARHLVDLAASDGATADAIAFTVAPNRPVTIVSAQVNGIGPFALEIDTGASGTSLSPNAAERAQVRAEGQGTLVGAGGPVAVRIGRARIDFGSLGRELPVVSVMPEIAKVAAAAGVPIDGIVGGDFLAGMRLTLDYPAHRLWLAASAARAQ